MEVYQFNNIPSPSPIYFSHIFQSQSIWPRHPKKESTKPWIQNRNLLGPHSLGLLSFQKAEGFPELQFPADYQIDP